MLRNQMYEQLDKEMNQIQLEFESGKRSDINLLHLFRAFYDTDGSLEERYEQWIKRFPKSYAAHEAQGIYYRRVGYQARGNKYSASTSDEQFSEMSRYLDLAARSHLKGINLSPKPLLTFYNLLSIAKLNGDSASAQHILQQAIKVAPKNFIVRYKYMLMLEGRWGGSLAQMRAFKVQSQEAGIPESLLQYFDEIIADEIRWQRQQ